MSDTKPRSYYGKSDELWTCVFPGKMGIAWKLAWNDCGTKEEAESRAAENCNVVAVPLALWRRLNEYQHRSTAAEQKLLEVAGLRLDYDDGEITFTKLLRY